MREFKSIRGSQETKPNKLEVNVDTVYIRENIVYIEEEEFSGWEYDEKQYGLKEYIELIGNENEELNKSVNLLEENGLMNMIAMAEMYEEKLQLEEDNMMNMVALTELYEIVMGG